MQINTKRLAALFLCCMTLVVTTQTASAEGVEAGIEIQFSDRPDEGDGIRDPENVDVIVDPPRINKTEGRLRFDFVPELNFGASEISNKNIVFPVNAQQFKDETTARGQFIQLSDYRDNPTGWTLQLRQETQFKSEAQEGAVLKGAVLSFDNSWTNSKKDASLAPKVSKEVIRLNNIGETYNLAEAAFGNGGGTWSIVFGASENNPNGQAATVSAKVDEQNKPVIDEAVNKAAYINSAVQLTVPAATEKQPGTYSTVLTWMISELP